MFDSLLFLILLSSILFLADVSLFFLYHFQFLYLVVCLYIFMLVNPHKQSRLIFLAALIALESFIFYSNLWAPLFAFVPLTFLEIQYRHNFYQSWGYKWGMGTIFMMAQILIIEPFLLDLPLSLGCTFFKLCANILIVGIISLKNFNQDKRDNRGVRF